MLKSIHLRVSVLQARNEGDGEEGGREGGLPFPFSKIEKSALILEKKVLIVSISKCSFKSI